MATGIKVRVRIDSLRFRDKKGKIVRGIRSAQMFKLSGVPSHYWFTFDKPVRHWASLCAQPARWCQATGCSGGDADLRKLIVR